MVQFAEINQVPSPYSMLQDIGSEATPKLVPTNCLFAKNINHGERGIGLGIDVRYCSYFIII